MFGFRKKENKPNLAPILDALKRNEISIEATEPSGSPYASRIGGSPSVPRDFVWPRFEAENYDGETANRPLSFLCQINLDEVRAFDREKMLPEKGMLLFFYEMESMCWGYDPADDGCTRVYYFEDIGTLETMACPDDLAEEYRIKEYGLSFGARDSYPDFEELDLHADTDCDWDEYDEALESRGCEIDCERHKLLGYADLIQGEIPSECERTERGLYCGDEKSYRETPDAVKADIARAATDWQLLFQMASIQDDDFELMFGDLGNLYFYIRRQDLEERRFDRVRFALQCG